MYNELIQQARELCNTAETNYYIDVVVPELCDALEAAQKEIERLNGDYGVANRAYHEWFDEAQKAIDRAEKAEAENRWIPVGERLPDHVDSYLVYYHEWSNGDFLPKYDDYRIRVMRFMNNGKWCMPVCTDKRCEADTNREVTHWHPLPQPPQKGE